MNSTPQIFKMFNSVVIVDNGVKKIINDSNIVNLPVGEILKIYNERRGSNEKT